MIIPIGWQESLCSFNDVVCRNKRAVLSRMQKNSDEYYSSERKDMSTCFLLFRLRLGNDWLVFLSMNYKCMYIYMCVCVWMFGMASASSRKSIELTFHHFIGIGKKAMIFNPRNSSTCSLILFDKCKTKSNQRYSSIRSIKKKIISKSNRKINQNSSSSG